MITVAISTFNRGELACRAIRSALSFVHPVGGKVIVVDDGSNEPIFPFIQEMFDAELKTSALAYFRQEINQGVTGGKNLAFEHCDAGWVLFLDSDDELIPESVEEVARALTSHTGDALMFFRCIDQNGSLVGRPFEASQVLTLRRYLTHTSYGEALVAINKSVAPAPPFDTDLRGYEGMGCARLIKQFGPALLMPIVARRYHRVGSDRLSTLSGMMIRSRLLSRGHLRYIQLFGDQMSPATRFKYRTKATLYFMLAALDRFLRSRNEKST